MLIGIKNKESGDYELYGEKTEDALEYGEMYLNVTECRELMKLVCPKDNGYFVHYIFPLHLLC